MQADEMNELETVVRLSRLATGLNCREPGRFPAVSAVHRDAFQPGWQPWLHRLQSDAPQRPACLFLLAAGIPDRVFHNEKPVIPPRDDGIASARQARPQ